MAVVVSSTKKVSWLKRVRYKKEYEEYLNVERQLRRKQIQSSAVFDKVKKDPSRSTGTDLELKNINDEANVLAFRLIELRKIFEPVSR